jgi:hypothetical protein
MNKKGMKTIIALGAIGSLAAVPAAIAAPGGVPGKPADPGSNGVGHQNGHGKPADPGSQGKGHQNKVNGPTVMYVFKGTYAGAGAVDVTKGNAHVTHAGLVGTTVNFDLANAKLSVADVNNDTVVDVNDISAGDKVVVKARLSKKTPGTQPFGAKQLVDQTHPAS